MAQEFGGAGGRASGTGKFLPYPAELARLLDSPAGPVARDLVRKAIKVQSGAKRRCPVDTGRLRDSIRWLIIRDGKGLAAKVGSDVEYAAAVHDGIKAQTVTVNRGTTSYIMQIPSRPARPFLKDALQDIRGL